MPEGHTIHRIANDHTQWFVGQKLKCESPQGRFAAEAAIISGKTLNAVDAFGKHLVYRFSTDKNLHIHLGLYGKFRNHDTTPPAPKGAVRIRLVGKHRAFDLNGPNQCELLSASEIDAALAKLGPDPLRDDADPEFVWQRIRNSSSAIGSLLLNQSVIAGIGNIYRSEILFILRIHPNRKGRDIDRKEFEKLWKLSVELFQIGMNHNKIITRGIKTRNAELVSVDSKESLWVYKTKNCPKCSGSVDTWELANRMAFACQQCQK